MNALYIRAFWVAVSLGAVLLLFGEKTTHLNQPVRLGNMQPPSQPIRHPASSIKPNAPITTTSALPLEARIDEEALAETLRQVLENYRLKKSGQFLSIKMLGLIARCGLCTQRLQDEMIYGDWSPQRLSGLTGWLTKGNHPELAGLLTETAMTLLNDQKDSKRFLVLAESLKSFSSPQTARYFTHYLVDARDIPVELQEALAVSIGSSTGRFEVAADIVLAFNGSLDAETQQKLLAINHPEAIAQINTQALAVSDTELYRQTRLQLESNASVHTLDALLSMPQMQYAEQGAANPVTETAYQLARQQLSGNRLDYIEDKLAQGAYSAQDKPVVLDVLAHSEDAIRANEIIAKFSN